MIRTASEIIAESDDLERRVAALVADKKPLQKQLSNINRTIGQLNAKRSELNDEARILNQKPKVSDHAVVRYLERKHGFDFETVRKDMLTDTVRTAMISGCDGATYDGGVVKIKDKTIVTFVSNKSKEITRKPQKNVTYSGECGIEGINQRQLGGNNEHSSF